MSSAAENTHKILDARHRRLSIAVAVHVREDPSHIERALARVRQQLDNSSASARWSLEQWRDLLEAAKDSAEGFAVLLDILTRDDEHATRLRSSSPFAGVISQAERENILVHDKNLQG